MTVGELRAFLAGLPDDMPVVVPDDDDSRYFDAGPAVKELTAFANGYWDDSPPEGYAPEQGAVRRKALTF